MQPLSILGPGASDIVDQLAAELSGRVAVLECEAVEKTGSGDAEARFTVAPDGEWTGTGRNRDLDGFLERLAPEVEYLLIAGDSRLRVPTILLDEDRTPDTVPGTVVLEANEGIDTETDIEAVTAALEAAEPYITLPELIDQIKQSPSSEYSGAIATFTGRVRARDGPQEDRTTHLAFEKYDEVAEQRLTAIESELEQRDGVLEVLTHHRTGVIADGEDIVYVVVLAGHRTEAFRAVEDGINQLKDRVPIFKKETTTQEEFWVHERSH